MAKLGYKLEPSIFARLTYSQLSICSVHLSLPDSHEKIVWISPGCGCLSLGFC